MDDLVKSTQINARVIWSCPLVHFNDLNFLRSGLRWSWVVLHLLAIFVVILLLNAVLPVASEVEVGIGVGRRSGATLSLLTRRLRFGLTAVSLENRSFAHDYILLACFGQQ